MSKKKKNTVDRTKYTGDTNITDIDIIPLTQEAMLSYYINVNYMRQIANLNDGLNPVERRILYTMFKTGLKPSGSTLKSAKIVGDTMSAHHPHGDASIYTSVVGLSHEWTTPFPYVVKSGNFGSQASFSDTAAGMRYTETKLTPFAWDAFFRDFNPNHVIMNDSYDGKTVEPEYLPSRYPIALLQGTFGIAAGIKVTIPSYNLNEVFKYTIELLDNPEKKRILYPDTPTGCDIIDNGTLKSVSETGTGNFTEIGKVEVDKENHRLIIRSFPSQVKVSNVRESILDMVDKGLIQGFDDIHMDSEFSPYDDGFTALVVYFKKEINLEEVKEQILKRTQVRKVRYINFVLIDDLKKKVYGVQEYLLEWLEARREYKQIGLTHMLIDTQSRIHNMEVFLEVVSGKNGEESLKVIRKAESREEITEFLRNKFGITSIQARAIANMRMGEFSADSIRKKKEEHKELKSIHKALKKRIKDPGLIDDEIREELEEGIKKYGRPRRSKIIKLSDKNVREPKVTNHRIMITSDRIIKKTNAGVEDIGFVEDGDAPIYLRTLTSEDELLIFDDQGFMYKVAVSDIASSELTSRGIDISTVVDITGNIVKIISSPGESSVNKDEFVVVSLSEGGIIKSSDLTEYLGNRSKLVNMKMDKKDKVVDVDIIPLSWESDIIVYSNNGKGVRYPLEEVRVTGRASKGVIGIDLSVDNTKAKGFTTVSRGDDIICITERGMVKRFSLDHFRTMRRTSKPLSIITIDKNDSIFSVLEMVMDTKVNVYTRHGVETFDPKDVPVSARLAKGKKTIPVRRGDNIITWKLEVK